MSADPTTLLGTIASLQLKQVDKETQLEADEEEERKKKKYEQSQVQDGGFTDFTDWNTVERPRTTDFGARDNQYLSAMAISGDDYLRYQARLNPYQQKKFKEEEIKSLLDIK